MCVPNYTQPQAYKVNAELFESIVLIKGFQITKIHNNSIQGKITEMRSGDLKLYCDVTLQF